MRGDLASARSPCWANDKLILDGPSWQPAMDEFLVARGESPVTSSGDAALTRGNTRRRDVVGWPRTRLVLEVFLEPDEVHVSLAFADEEIAIVDQTLRGEALSNGELFVVHRDTVLLDQTNRFTV